MLNKLSLYYQYFYMCPINMATFFKFSAKSDCGMLLS